MNKTPTQRVYVIKLPMRIRTSSKKVTALNLNVYRNLHYRSLTALKHKFQNLGKKLLKDAGIPPLGRIQLRYMIYAKDKRKFDIVNFGSIVDKFFSDTLTQEGIIEDDNYTFLDDVSFGFGGITAQEHILVTITEIEPRKGNAMRILLDEDEIQSALEAFVETMGLTGVTGVELTSDAEGTISAEVLMNEANTTKTRKTPAKAKGGRPTGSKNKPKEESDNVVVSGQDSNAGDGSGDVEPTEDKASEDKTSSEDKAETKTGGSASKNLFGDEETESSKSDVPEETKDAETTTKVSKSSIFDQ
jgi:hypothetical protein